MVGIDIVYLKRLELKESFINHVLTNEELLEFNNLKEDFRKLEYIGGRIAVKEAIFKASQDKDYLSYSCLHNKNGKPYILNHPEIDVSISHDKDYAIAIVNINN